MLANPDIQTSQIEYEVLRKEYFVFSEYKTDTLYKGDVLLILPDTLITYYDISKRIIDICLKENMPFSKFYLSKDCLHELEKNEGSTEYKFTKCYIGYVDLRPKGLNWRYFYGMERDVRFNTSLSGYLKKGIIFKNYLLQDPH